MKELNEEQLNELKSILSEVGAYLPEKHAPYLWDRFNEIREVQEARPCTCQSSGHHWKRCVDFLFDYVKTR
jgi:hypothetical protein